MLVWLSVILETCFASIIRHLPEIVRLCGAHCLVATTMFQAAEKIGLNDARFPSLDPRSVLLNWSEMIKDNYRKDLEVAKMKTMNLSTDTGALFSMLSQVARDVKELKNEKKNTELDLAKEKALTNYLTQQNERLQSAFDEEKRRTKVILKQFYSSPGSPSASASSKRTRRDVDEPTALNFGEEFSNALQASNPVQAVASPNQTDAFHFQDTIPAGGDSNHPSVPRSTQVAASVVNETTALFASQVVAPPPARSRTVALTYNNAAYGNAEGEQGNMKEFLRDVLTEMSLHGMIDRSALNSNSKYLTRWQRNKTLLFRCLELVAFAGDESDIEILENGMTETRTTVKDAAYRLETAAHAKLLEFEDSSIEINDRSKRPKKTFTTGMGKRVKEYKKRVWAARGNVGKFDAAAVSIIEYEALKQMEQQQQPGTPAGHRNVRSYFNRI